MSDDRLAAELATLRERNEVPFEDCRARKATGTDLSPLTWQRTADGDWRAFTGYRGLTVRLDVIAADEGTRCPCQPGPCQHPGVPVVTVYATSSVPMTTLEAGSHCNLTSAEQSVHAAGGAGQEPGDVLGSVARLLAVAAAGSGQAALAELAAHAARLDTGPAAAAAAADVVTEGGDVVRRVAARLLTATLTCLTPGEAGIVAEQAARPGDQCHGARQDGNRVIFTYFDKRYPYDIASWAWAHGYVSDAEAANTIALL